MITKRRKLDTDDWKLQESRYTSLIKVRRLLWEEPHDLMKVCDIHVTHLQSLEDQKSALRTQLEDAHAKLMLQEVQLGEVVRCLKLLCAW